MARDPYRYFRVEARELLEQLGAGVLDLEKGAEPAAAVARLLRVAHTLKGAARVVKHREVADLAHAVEDALEPVRDAGAAVDRGRVDALLGLVDGVAACLRALDAPVAAAAESTPSAAAAAAADDGAPALRADDGALEALLANLTEATAQLALARQALQPFERLRSLAKLLGDQVSSPRGLASQGTAQKLGALVDELRGTVAALERDLGAGVERAEREVRHARESAERLRLLPAALLFHSLERTARDAGVGVGRRVAFEGAGGEVRLEGRVLAAVGAALVQAVRNAVAHGIEPAAARAAAGKAPVGRVAVTVSRRGDRVCFACADDGAGVDLEAVRAAAERRGMSAREAGALGPDELGRLLLGGGISTSAAVTELAGRGVGLDLVRATAEGLGGEVELRTERGRGTTVELVVPVLASSLESLVVEASGQVVAIPLSATRRTLRVLAGELTRGPDGETVAFDGAAIPFLALDRALGRSPGGAARAWAAVVVESGGALLAVGVDRLVGVESVVLRPLPELAPPHPAVIGVWLDAAGRARVVVDPAGLLAAAARRGADPGAASTARPTILVIDDSLTTRMLEQSILESAGYEVDVAVSGEEALAKARERSYGLFLVDVEMPGMDGFTFIERARAEPALRAVPAILVTSRASPEDRARGAAAGAVGHIEKSEFNQAELVARIRGLIG